MPIHYNGDNMGMGGPMGMRSGSSMGGSDDNPFADSWGTGGSDSGMGSPGMSSMDDPYGTPMMDPMAGGDSMMGNDPMMDNDPTPGFGGSGDAYVGETIFDQNEDKFEMQLAEAEGEGLLPGFGGEAEADEIQAYRNSDAGRAEAELEAERWADSPAEAELEAQAVRRAEAELEAQENMGPERPIVGMAPPSGFSLSDSEISIVKDSMRSPGMDSPGMDRSMEYRSPMGPSRMPMRGGRGRVRY